MARVEVSPEVVRVIRLTLSAARADGTLTPHEREAILSQARGVGAEALIAAELDAPKPLEEILGNAPGGRAAEDLYTLAFSIVRADEEVLPAERDYLSRLAAALGIAADTATRLEQQAADRIAAYSPCENESVYVIGSRRAGVGSGAIGCLRELNYSVLTIRGVTRRGRT